MRATTEGRVPGRLTATLLALITLVGALAIVGSAPASPAAADGYPTIDGRFSGIGSVGAGESVSMKVVGRGGVPLDDVGAVVLNVTVTNTTAPSFLTVYPAGEAIPGSSNLNFVAGQTVPNLAVAKVGEDGLVSFFNMGGDVDLVVDVLGWFPTGTGYVGLTPARLLDTRPGGPTTDGAFSGGGAIGAAGQLVLPVAGRGGIPATAESVVLNVTVTNPTVASYLSLWPTGADRPTAANLNYAPGQTVSNMAIVALGDDASVSMFNLTGSTDVVVDVLGYFPGRGTFTGVTPARLMDTRPGLPTIDGGDGGEGVIGAQDVTTLEVTGRGRVPTTGVGAVALNVTVTEPTAESFLTVWPTGTSRPTASNLNFRAGQTVPNMVVVDVGTDGKISLYNLAGSAHVVVDVLGWFADSGAYRGVVPARLMDTRSVPDPAEPPTTGPPWPDTGGSPTIPPDDPSLDPFVCRTYTHHVVGTVASNLNEISGMARGRRDRSVVWVHNDSGAQPDVFALSLTGQTRQTFRLSGAAARDWEDMDVGPGPEPGNYLYMGDIGDNGKVRSDITVYRVPEPAVTGAGGVTALSGTQALVARYPDGPHNAEAMAVGADGTIYVITKETSTRVYAMRYPQSTTSVNTMVEVAAGVLAARTDMSGADIRPDGRALIVRGYRDAWTWPIRLGEPLATSLQRTPCHTATFRAESQGEAVAFLGNDGSYMSSGEMVNAPLRFYTL